MTSSEVRKKYLDFFIKRDHKLVPSSSLVPENDPTTLFTGSGMQPMIPYLLGEKHPLGKRIVDSQKSFRSQDIEEVGDNFHTTFFEMLGNWSLGDYWKEEQLRWFFEFLVDKKEGLSLDPSKLYVSAFEGNNEIPKDEETIKIWQKLFKEQGVDANLNERIYLYGVEKNWWSRSGTPDQMPVGEPGGPDSEVFYLFEEVSHDEKYGKKCHPNCECGAFLEIGNSVFMQYQKTKDGFQALPQKNVDFGGGLERLTAVTENAPDIFLTDLYFPIIKELEKETGVKYKDSSYVFKIIADHIKASSFLIKDGVTPSNKLQGYVLRRLLRRSAVKLSDLDLDFANTLSELSSTVINIYKDTDYFNKDDKEKIKQVIKEELEKFEKTIKKGLKEIEKIDKITGKIAFDLYQTFGFPFEITAEVAREKGQKVNLSEFEEEFKKHQELSRTTSAGVFKGGLSDSKEKTTKLHTANHLLQAALREILGIHIRQHGSNITSERLRFDFSNDQKLTDEEIKKVEDLVNQKIQDDLLVHFDIEEKGEAIKNGALANVGENYPDKVKVYKIGYPPGHPEAQSAEGSYFSQELCGGPHVEHTGVIGTFKILKQENLGSGLRRIYATVE